VKEALPAIFEALADLLHEHSDNMMFCSDDKHPDSLLIGPYQPALCQGCCKRNRCFQSLKAACINPVEHYKLNVGLLRVGDPADFIVAEDLVHFKILRTYIDGELVAEEGRSLGSQKSKVKSESAAVNNFHCDTLDIDQLSVRIKEYPSTDGKIPVIEALDGQLITNKLMLVPKISGKNI
jgi:adenine deaminase